MPIDVTMFDSMQPELIRFYEQAEVRLDRVLAQASTTSFEYRRTQLLLQQIDSIVRALEDHQQGWAQKNLPSAYRRGMVLSNEAMGFPVLPGMTLIDRLGAQTAVARVMAETSGALESIAPFAKKVWIDTQQAIVHEKQIARLVAEGIVDGLGSDELGRRIRQTLQDGATQRLKGYVPDALRAELQRTARGEMIAITGKDGKLRHYKLKHYGELVARTATRQAATEGAIARTVQAGQDLVQISVHTGSCPVCLPIQGKVFSLTGNTPGFPTLQASQKPPIHPNCRHVLVGVNREIMEARGLLQPMREMSGSAEAIPDVNAMREALAVPVTSIGVAV